MTAMAPTPPRPQTTAHRGRLIAFVGPSGVGKDSLMSEVAQLAPQTALVRRHITRAPGLGGEDYQHLSVDSFQDLTNRGAYALHWQAHGLYYGIPRLVESDLAGGTDMLVNLSRGVLEEAHALFSPFLVINITADPAILAKRLASRGRETPQDIEARLARRSAALPPNLNAHTIENNGTLRQGALSIADILRL